MTAGFGGELRVRRAECGISQTELAALTGIAQANISRIEAGTMSPTERTMARLLDALGGSTGGATLGHARPVRAHEPGVLTAVELDGDMSEPDWLIDGLVSRGAVTMLAGAPGAGKSMIAQALAVRMAGGGGSVAGIEVQGGRAMILDAENGDALIRTRLAGMGLQAAHRTRLHVFATAGFDIESDADALAATLAETPTDLLILDSWATLWSGQEGWAEAVKHCLNGLRAVARGADCGVLLIHHTTKGTDTYRGSGAIAGTIEGVFTFTRDHDATRPDVRLLRCEKLRLGPEPAPRRMTVTPAGAERVTSW